MSFSFEQMNCKIVGKSYTIIILCWILQTPPESDLNLFKFFIEYRTYVHKEPITIQKEEIFSFTKYEPSCWEW